MAQKPKRIFHDFREFEDNVENATKEAIEGTAEELRDKLRDEYIAKRIYGAHIPTFYDRTYSLLDDSTVEIYTYKNMKNRIGVGIRFNDSFYSAHSKREDFQHGNDVRYLPMGSFLEIMNDSSKLHPNPYNFPTNIDRHNFYDEFVKYANEQFPIIFDRRFNVLMLSSGRGTRPKAVPKTPVSGGMNLSSSTAHLKSVNTRTTTMATPPKKY